MATLPDSFVADLEEFSDEESDVVDDEDAVLSEESVDEDQFGIESDVNYDIDQDTMNKLEVALTKEYEPSDDELILQCNSLSAEIDSKLRTLHNVIRDKYRSKFPELESLVSHPVDYARVVKKIGNETDLTLVDLKGLLPSAVIMVVSVTASTTSGKPLPNQVLQKTMEACDRALTLDAARKKVVDFIENRMGHIAPNLSAIVGSAVAAKLMGAVGGLERLVMIPDLRLLGAKKKPLAGYSSTASRAGYLTQTEIFQSTPPALKDRAAKMLASKSSLAVKVDHMKTDPMGVKGRDYRDKILKQLEKGQEPRPARGRKPLPVPDLKPRKKRGGARQRKRKERYGMTEMRKLANKVPFGVVAEESSLGDGFGVGYGMLGQAGCGKLRVVATSSKLGVKAANKFKDRLHGSRGAAASGLATSLAFSTVQGIELINPQVVADQHSLSTYFSGTATFSGINRA